MNGSSDESGATIAPPQSGQVKKTVFLYTAINRDGEKVTERIESTSLATARYTLELRGYSSITFHTDAWEKTFQQWVGQTAEVDCSAWTPETGLETRTSGGAWAHVVCCFKEWKIFWLSLVVWNTLSVLAGPPYGWISWLGFLLSGWLCVYFTWTTLPGVAYQRLLNAKVWAKWSAVHRWVACLQFFKRFGIAPLPDMHLDAYLAKALAAEGQLTEAVAILSKYENDQSVPRSFFYSELGAVYEKGRLPSKAIEYRARAVEASTGSVAEYIDYALSLLRYLRDPQQARKALAKISDQEIPDLAALYVSYCWGLVALEEGDYKEAKIRLLETLPQATPYAANVLMLEFFMDIKVHLAIVLAKLGDKHGARRFFNEVKHFLIAHQEVDLLQRCREVGEEL